MGFRRQELLEIIKTKRIEFPGSDGKPSDKFLDIDYRVKAMSHGRKKPLMDNVFSIQSSAVRAKKLSKDLENKSLSEVERERLQGEVGEIAHQIQSLVEPLVDYLAGTDKSPAAIVKWDLLDDFDAPLPITREVITDLDEETISTIAWALLGDTSVGESNAPGSSQQSEVASREQSSTVPA